MKKYISNQVLFALIIAICVASADAARADYRDEALKWLDAYRKVQVLFNDKDIAKLRDKLADATEEQAQMWLDDTKEIRAALDSREWKETRNWLDDFLKVQAIYSDEEINEFRQRARDTAEESPEKFIDLLLDVEQKRAGLVGGAANSARIREHQLEINQQFRQEAANARAAARKAAARSSAASTSNQPNIQRRERRRAPTLVDSMDVARWSVMRGFWPRW